MERITALYWMAGQASLAVLMMLMGILVWRIIQRTGFVSRSSLPENATLEDMARSDTLLDKMTSPDAAVRERARRRVIWVAGGAGLCVATLFVMNSILDGYVWRTVLRPGVEWKIDLALFAAALLFVGLMKLTSRKSLPDLNAQSSFAVTMLSLLPVVAMFWFVWNSTANVALYALPRDALSLQATVEQAGRHSGKGGLTDSATIQFSDGTSMALSIPEHTVKALQLLVNGQCTLNYLQKGMTVTVQVRRAVWGDAVDRLNATRSCGEMVIEKGRLTNES
ncbi:hypothetical protein [Caballeronia sordidicola]|uniref:hypothetical protein n=1 Tax=Caballeronia sordidicola TaxID=196367 RepID=UPI000B7810A6|nr:hypothetical protein [Caballeronia sordidicola]